MARTSSCIKTSISFGNVLIIILAILICCLSLGDWNDYVTCAFTILIALAWSFWVCVEDNTIISVYTGLMILDLVFLLANAIFHTVRNAQYSQHCFHNNWDAPPPIYGCHDWRNGQCDRNIGVIVCFFLAFILRLFSIVGNCLLARESFMAHSDDY